MGKTTHKPRVSDGRAYPVSTRKFKLTLDDVLPSLRATALDMAGGDRTRIQVLSPARVTISPR